MSVVKPFSAWHYNTHKFKNLSEVVAPPYDVISAEELAEMKKKSPYHYTRVILPEGENKHIQAAELLRTWQREEILVQDKKPALYFYRQTFNLTPAERFCQSVPGHSVATQGHFIPMKWHDSFFVSGASQPLSRTSIFARIGLEDYSAKIILPHEKTFSGPKADRYKLMESTQGNMEPVFLGYDSPRFSGDEFEKIILSQKPTEKFIDDAGVSHELWAITDEKVIAEVEKVLGPKKFYILDGHHRYETALKFYHDHQAKDARLDHRYVLAAICSFRQPGTVILPTHRALKVGEVDKAKKNLMGLGWEWSEVSDRKILEEKLMGSKVTCFGLKIPRNEKYVFLKAPKDLEKLDLDVLHDLVLPVFDKDPQLDYIKDLDELEAKVDQGIYQIGFLVRPSTVDEVMSVAEHGSVMPHKSTFFYPKIPSGFVINTFS